MAVNNRLTGIACDAVHAFLGLASPCAIHKEPMTQWVEEPLQSWRGRVAALDTGMACSAQEVPL